MANFYGRYAGIFGGGGGGGGGGNLPSQLLADVAPVANGSPTVTVVFGTPFLANPVVVPTLANTTDAGPIQLSIIETAVSTTGFTVTLSAPAPNGNYFLPWMAAAIND